MSAPLLELEGVRKSFRGLRAVDGVTTAVEEGSITALIGPNGAGKTTLFNLVAGMMAPDSGSIRLAGREIAGLRPDQVCAAGIGRTFQLVKPFAGLTVEENVMVGALHRLHRPSRARERAHEVLALLGLAERAALPAHALTLPDRKRLEVARALATGPRLLLLDEVMAGLRPTETDRLVATFTALNRDTGLTILLIEHVMRAVMALSERVLVLNYGRLIADGSPAGVVRDPEVIACYLGAEAIDG